MKLAMPTILLKILKDIEGIRRLLRKLRHNQKRTFSILCRPYSTGMNMCLKESKGLFIILISGNTVVLWVLSLWCVHVYIYIYYTHHCTPSSWKGDVLALFLSLSLLSSLSWLRRSNAIVARTRKDHRRNHRHGMSWYVMVCHDMSWYVMVCHGMSWYVMVCHGMSWYVMVCHGMSWYVMVCHGMSWYVMVCHGMSWLHTKVIQTCSDHIRPSKQLLSWESIDLQAQQRLDAQPARSQSQWKRFFESELIQSLDWLFREKYGKMQGPSYFMVSLHDFTCKDHSFLFWCSKKQCNDTIIWKCGNTKKNTGFPMATPKSIEKSY